MSTLISFFPLLIIVFIIVGLWRKRPLAAFILAAMIMVVPLPLIEIVKTFQATLIYGTDDPQIMAGGLSQALKSLLIITVIGLPLIALFQWGMRRLFSPKQPKEDVDKTFS